MDDFKPLPRWKQRQRQMVAWWRRNRDARRRTLKSFRIQVQNTLTLAISVVGGMLISYGVWLVYVPAGFATGGILLWAIQWNYGSERSSG
jgi:hypothetical protein